LVPKCKHAKTSVVENEMARKHVPVLARKAAEDEPLLNYM